MTKSEFESENGVKLVRKDELWEMRLIAWVFNLFPKYARMDGTKIGRGDRFMKYFWTTWKRLPWSKHVHICHGTSEMDPMGWELAWLRTHELFHVRSMKTLWGWIKTAFLYVLVPLPVFYSGRWYIEREAYLNDINSGILTIDQAIEQLWADYFMPWPKKKMKAWFEEQSKMVQAA